MPYLSPPQPLGFTLLLSLSALPLALWFAYHYSRTGYVFGNPEFFRYNVETTLAPGRILLVMLNRLWHVTGHMHLFVLTLATAWATAKRSILQDDGVEREAIAARTKAVLLLVILAHIVALSLVGGAVLARYMLPVIPLAMLLYIGALWRRVRRWREIIAIVCLAFVIGLFVNPPHRFPWEENLAYRDYVLLHKDAAAFIATRHPNARVLTMWTATDELMKPDLGYVPHAISVVPVEHFSTKQLQAAVSRGTPFDTVLLFSTNHYNDLRPEQAAALLNADIIYRRSRHGQWIAVLQVK
jgi:hypothetical protein